MKLTAKHVMLVAILSAAICYLTHSILRYKLTIRAGEFVLPMKKALPQQPKK